MPFFGFSSHPSHTHTRPNLIAPTANTPTLTLFVAPTLPRAATATYTPLPPPTPPTPPCPQPYEVVAAALGGDGGGRRQRLGANDADADDCAGDGHCGGGQTGNGGGGGASSDGGGGLLRVAGAGESEMRQLQLCANPAARVCALVEVAELCRRRVDACAPLALTSASAADAAVAACALLDESLLRHLAAAASGDAQGGGAEVGALHAPFAQGGGGTHWVTDQTLQVSAPGAPEQTDPPATSTMVPSASDPPPPPSDLVLVSTEGRYAAAQPAVVSRVLGAVGALNSHLGRALTAVRAQVLSGRGSVGGIGGSIGESIPAEMLVQRWLPLWSRLVTFVDTYGR